MLCACEGVVGHTKLNKRDRKERDAVGGQRDGGGGKEVAEKACTSTTNKMVVTGGYGLQISFLLFFFSFLYRLVSIFRSKCRIFSGTTGIVY